MKKILVALTGLLLLLALSACGGENRAPDVASMYNAEQDVTISIGMSKEEVETLLGEITWHTVPLADSSEHDPYGATYGTGADALQVQYQDDAVIALSCYISYTMSHDILNWRTSSGLTYGSTLEEVTAQYGEGERQTFAEFPEVYMLAYYFDKTGKPVETLASASYVISFGMSSETDTVYSCGVGTV